MTQYVKKLIWVTFFFLFLAANMTQISNFANRVKKSMQIKQWNMTQIVNFANRIIISMLIKQWNMTQIVNFANRVKKSMQIKQWNMTQISNLSNRVKFSLQIYYQNMTRLAFSHIESLSLISIWNERGIVRKAHNSALHASPFWFSTHSFFVNQATTRHNISYRQFCILCEMHLKFDCDSS